MKRLILSILVVLAIATIATVSIGCKSDNTSSSGNTELQGTWVENSSDNEMTVTLAFNGNSYTLTLAAGSDSVQKAGTFTINPTATPKTIDIVLPINGQNSTSLGIYELSGNSLKLDMREPGNTTRPTAFSEEALNLIKQ